MSNIQRYNPFSELVSLREAMDRLFEDSFISPRLSNAWGSRGVGSNLYETAEGYTLQIPMPGVKPDDVEITVRQDTINVKWESKMQAPEGATAHWNYLQSGQYQQSFTLPSAVDADRVQASYNDGILTLSLPKVEQAKTRTIKVNSH
jgi:HSP20 family protein